MAKPFRMNAGARIRLFREIRGFSQENLAAKLNMTQASYSRIETNQTKLDTVLLEKIAKELDVTTNDILSNDPAIINFASNQGAQGVAHIEHFYSIQKDLLDKIVASKDSEIANLKEVIASLVKDKEALMELLKQK